VVAVCVNKMSADLQLSRLYQKGRGGALRCTLGGRQSVEGKRANCKLCSVPNIIHGSGLYKQNVGRSAVVAVIPEGEVGEAPCCTLGGRQSDSLSETCTSRSSSGILRSAEW